jgi:hypothetical protein
MSDFHSGVFNMQALNIANITSLTNNALDAGRTLFNSCVELQGEFKGCDADTVKTTMFPIVVKWYGLKTKTQGTGRVVMQGDATTVNTATTALARLVEAIVGKVSDAKAKAKAKEDFEVPADILEAAAKLWALCAEYKEAQRVCATALAQVKAG